MKYSNGVEARIGDVFKMEIPEFCTTIATIEKAEQIISYETMRDNFADVDVSITLLRRPFQVGDKYQGLFKDIAGEMWSDVDAPLKCADLANSLIAYGVIRHTNPLWRDHPDYVRGEE